MKAFRHLKEKAPEIVIGSDKSEDWNSSSHSEGPGIIEGNLHGDRRMDKNIIQETDSKDDSSYNSDDLLEGENSLEGYTLSNTLTEGETFGELALISKQKRSATVKCISDCHFGVILKEDFQKVFGRIAEEQLQTKIDILN